jgi:hypothetical protein
MGCLGAIVRQIGCLVLLIAAVVLAVIYRRPLWEAYQRVRGARPPAAAVYEAPGPDGARAATERLAGLSRPGGPAYVDLTAADVAALLDRDVVRASDRLFDSVRVALDSDVILVRAVLDLSRLPRDFLGPLSGSFEGREPIETGGTLLASAGGTVRWVPDRLRIHDFPIPRQGIPSLLRSLHVASPDGGVVLPGITGVGDVRVVPERVRVYRLEQR